MTDSSDRQKDVAPLAVSVERAARLCGVSHATAYRMTQDGTLRVVRLRGTLRVPMAAIDELLAGDQAAATR